MHTVDEPPTLRSPVPDAPDALRARRSGAPATDRAARAARPLPAWLGPEISPLSAGSVLLAWAAVTLLLPVLEPTPAHPETGVWATLLGVSLTVGMMATMAAVALRRRAGLWVSAGTVLVSLGAAVMCPVSGHHHFGVWWLGELALLAGVGVATERALRRG